MASTYSGIDGFLGATALGLLIYVLSGIESQKDDHQELMAIVYGIVTMFSLDLHTQRCLLCEYLCLQLNSFFNQDMNN